MLGSGRLVEEVGICVFDGVVVGDLNHRLRGFHRRGGGTDCYNGAYTGRAWQKKRATFRPPSTNAHRFDVSSRESLWELRTRRTVS